MRTNWIQTFLNAYAIGSLRSEIERAVDPDKARAKLEQMRERVAADPEPLPRWEEFLAKYDEKLSR